MTSDDNQSIRLLLDHLAGAVNAGKTAAISDSIAPNARGFVPGLPVLEGRDAILSELRTRLSTWQCDLRVSCSEIGVKDRWGFCSGRFGLRSVCIGRPKTRYTDAKFLGIVHKGIDRSWRLYRIAWSSNLPCGANDEQADA